jgi:hypothetical protein
MGFLGILEDKKLPHVPATVILSEEQHITNEATVGLKRGTGKDADIILIPQPSVDPILLPLAGGHRYRLHEFVT